MAGRQPQEMLEQTSKSSPEAQPHFVRRETVNFPVPVAPLPGNRQDFPAADEYWQTMNFLPPVAPLPGNGQELLASDEYWLDDCPACLEPVRKGNHFISQNCSDPCIYHKACIVRMFEVSLKYEAVVAQCCSKTIPLESVVHFLPSELASKVEAKDAERNMSSKVYCHKPTCSSLIKVENIQEDRAFCSKCAAMTCCKCKAAWHEGECTNKEFDEVLAMAKEEGWRACPKCQRMVELEEGCCHMSCLCGCNFCYECGQDLDKEDCGHE